VKESRSDKLSDLHLRVGELVEVKSKSEILATLDTNGRIDGLPFMPEMFQYCGKTFRVYKRAHKACDTVHRSGSRGMDHTVHLEDARCNGSFHGGCQAACLIFWKEAWLRRTDARATTQSTVAPSEPLGNTSDEVVFRTAHTRTNEAGHEEEIFFCQATELPKATYYLAWWDIRQYVTDIRSGNIKVSDLARGLLVSLFNMAVRVLRRCVLAVRSPMNAAANGEPVASGGAVTRSASGVASPWKAMLRPARFVFENWLVQYPHIQGALDSTPLTPLHLQPGELVQVKSKDEIVGTLDVNNRNRGLSFDGEMVPYCGGTYTVLSRVDRIVDERTGRMLRFPNSCIILDGVICKGCLSRNRLFCPRSTYSYWRETWLERIN
jgi:hypothetical protein